MCAARAMQTQYAVVAKASRPGPLPFVLKEAETFAIFDAAGDVRGDDGNELGIFHEGTRYVSRLELFLWGVRPLVLSSGVRDDNCTLAAHLTNPDIEAPGENAIHQGTISLQRSTALRAGACAQRFHITNFGHVPLDVPIALRFGADFADVFEVRGMRRTRRGELLPPQREHNGVQIGYHGLDGRLRTVRLAVGPAEVQWNGDVLECTVHVAPRAAADLFIGMSFADGANDPMALFTAGRDEAYAKYRTAHNRAAAFETNNELFNVWINRSFADLHMLATDTSHGLFPYAGIPWYCCPFGRDGLITARECLLIEPSLARGVLGYLAASQATEKDPERDAEPGKIVHEMRLGEMAATAEVPFGRYYGSADATPLFIMLAGDYLRRTGDVAFIRQLWPHLELALRWMEEWGDVDGDGYVEYLSRTERGLVNQGWKDSHDSVFHEDGSDAEGAIALCEVQAYAFAALRSASEMAHAVGLHDAADRFLERAERLQARFDSDFWSPRLETYALALDGSKQPCHVISSNAGHALFCGIASPHHAEGVHRALMADGSFSGWGVRTLDVSAARYNPMSYHNGSVWPHDNAIIALGLARYGYKDAVLRIINGLFDASVFMPMHRMPELFCGFARQPDEGPTMYPVACLPQAWATGTVFALLEACLGLSVVFDRHGQAQVRLDDPVLPTCIDELEIRNLQVGADSIHLALRRFGDDIATSIIRRPRHVQLVVRK